jgi:hypothetical protein
MYAQFDSSAPQPSPVIGWHETMTPAAQLVLPANLLTLTQAQWDNRLNTPFISGGALVAAPVPTAAQFLSTAQATQLAAIESGYQAAIQQPIAYMGTSFQADTASQNLMAQTIIGLQAIVAIGGTVPAGFSWWDANNVAVPMTLVQLQGLYATGVAAVNTAFARKQSKKAAVRAATTPAAVITINF